MALIRLIVENHKQIFLLPLIKRSIGALQIVSLQSAYRYIKIHYDTSAPNMEIELEFDEDARIIELPWSKIRRSRMRVYVPLRLFSDIKGTSGTLAQEVFSFIIDRLKVQQREAGVRHDLIDAVFALGGEDDLVRLLARVKALQAFVEKPEGADLLAGYKRAANILKKEGWGPMASHPGEGRDP